MLDIGGKAVKPSFSNDFEVGTNHERTDGNGSSMEVMMTLLEYMLNQHQSNFSRNVHDNNHHSNNQVVIVVKIIII